MGFIIFLFDIFRSLIIFETFCFCVIKKISLVFPIIKRQFGIGLFGLSEPLIFKVHATFSGALAWPYVYPWPQRPEGLIESAFDELARRWIPILNAFDDVGVYLA